MDDKELDKMAKDIEPAAIETDGSVEDIEEPVVEDSTDEEVAPAPGPANEGSSGGRKLFLIAVIVLVIAGLGGLGAWAYLDGQSARSQVSSLKQGLEAARADAAKLRADAVKTADTTDQEPADIPAVKDEDAVIAAAKAHAHAPKNNEKDDVKITVAKLEASFARVSVSVEGAMGGYSCTLKKVDGIWLVLFCGQSAPLQDELDKYGVPASVIPS